MSKIIKCDSCQQEIKDVYGVKMKEFFYDLDLGDLVEHGGFLPWPRTRKIKVHLCDECFKNLKNICKTATNEVRI